MWRYYWQIYDWYQVQYDVSTIATATVDDTLQKGVYIYRIISDSASALVKPADALVTGGTKISIQKNQSKQLTKGGETQLRIDGYKFCKYRKKKTVKGIVSTGTEKLHNQQQRKLQQQQRLLLQHELCFYNGTLRQAPTTTELLLQRKLLLQQSSYTAEAPTTTEAPSGLETLHNRSSYYTGLEAPTTAELLLQRKTPQQQQKLYYNGSSYNGSSLLRRKLSNNGAPTTAGSNNNGSTTQQKQQQLVRQKNQNKKNYQDCEAALTGTQLLQQC